AVKHQFPVFDELHAVRLSELFGTLTDEIHMGTFVEHQPRCANGIAQALDTGYATGAHGAAVHEECIELHTAIAGKEAATSSMECIVIFEDGNCGFNRIDSRRAFAEQSITSGQSIGHAALVRVDHVIGNSPGAAVDQEYRCMWHTRTPDCIGKRRQ